MKRLLSFLFMGVFLYPLIGQAQEELISNPESVARGKQLSQVCERCHLADGSGSIVTNVEARPRITGLDPAYFTKQIKDYKAGTRKNSTMGPMAMLLSEQQIEDVANYYASLPIVQDKVVYASQAMLARGRQLVEVGDWDRYIPACSACHGTEARGVGANFPNLNEQPAEYIERQIYAWRKGTRQNDLLGLMKPIAERLSEKDIKAVSAWLAEQPAY